MDKSTAQLIDRLDHTLQQSLERHRQLTSLLERKRQALRDGRPQDMTRLGGLEQGVVQAIAQLEQQRAATVAELATKLRLGGAEPVKMKDLAEALPEPFRGRVLLSRKNLIAAMQQVREQTSIVRRASEALMAHVNGLIRTLGVVSHGGAAYGQTGRVQARPPRMSSLNLTA